MKIAIISDVHSNNYALEAALTLIKKFGVDHVIFIGDLLTYGCTINESIYSLLEFSVNHSISFIKGNHDQIYFDAQNEKKFQYKPLPDFIVESVVYTNKKLDYKLIETFNWKNNIIFENIFFSHANALDYGNWSYLNSTDEIKNTANSVIKNNCLGGIFGHTHRNKFSLYGRGVVTTSNTESFEYSIESYKCFITNTGSIGQPRGGASSFLLVHMQNNSIKMEHIYFEYDIDAHKNSITMSTMTSKTKNKLLSYFN